MHFVHIAQLIVLALFAMVLIVLLMEYISFIKYKGIFPEDYLRKYKRKRAARYKLLVPSSSSIRYRKTEELLSKAGWTISVEYFFVSKALLFIVALTLIVNIQATNQRLRVEEVIKDINYRRIAFESQVKVTPEAVKLEEKLYKLVNGSINKGNELYRQENEGMYLEYIQNLIIGSDFDIAEDLGNTAKRMFEKLKTIEAERNNLVMVISALIAAMLIYMLPDLLASIKLKLIEDRKDWEVLNCIYAFSIFGSMPPYSVRTVLESMEMVTEEYKPLINKLLEGVKKGAAAKVFESTMEGIKNEDLYELLETMRLACDTGMLNAAGDMDGLADQKLKWMEITGLKRRRGKRLYAMTLVAVMFLLAGIYFSYGLTIMSNPAYLFPK